MIEPKNLFTRITIALLGIPAVIGLIFLGGIYLTIFLIVVSSIALWELFDLLNNKGLPPGRYTTILAGIILLLTAGLNPDMIKYAVPLITVMLLLTILIGDIRNSVRNIASSIFSTVYIPLNLSFILLLRQIEPAGFHLTLIMIVTVWVCDTFAYSFGSWLGRRPLAPKISPNKSITGGIAGFAGSLLTVYIFYVFKFIPVDISLIKILGLGALIGIFTQIGDLIESVIKRDMEVKDSGSILLGHGGVLDRFDSIIIVSPVVYFYTIFVLSNL